MINFACKQFNLEDIIKCGLGLTKTELKIMEYFLQHSKKECTTKEISQELNLNITTIQKAVKKFFNKGIIIRHQKNLNNGGYVYTYECNAKSRIKKILKEIVKNWAQKAEDKINKWE